jgi:AcrR family transcriptional regulator
MESARNRILDAAESRILSAGPGGLVLDTIAADAGVSKGGLLYHFPSKEALVAGLCERMLDGFERTLASLTEADGSAGSWTRAYLASTVTRSGRPADESAQLMAAILATLGRDSAHLEAVREHFARWHRRIAQDGIDPNAAIIVRLAADGLWLSSLLGLNQLDDTEGPSVISALRSMTRPGAGTE